MSTTTQKVQWVKTQNGRCIFGSHPLVHMMANKARLQLARSGQEMGKLVNYHYYIIYILLCGGGNNNCFG